MKKWGSCFAALAAMGLVACSGARRTTELSSKSASLAIQGRIQALSADADALRVAITVDGVALPGSPFAVTGGRFSATAIVAPGTHTIVARAGSYEAHADVEAVFGPNSVTLYLFDTSDPRPFQSAPIVESLGVSPSALTVLAGQAVPTSAVSSTTVLFDANATLSYAWSDSCGGTFSDATATPTYTPPAVGTDAHTCTITLTATATGPNGAVSDPVFSKATTTLAVSYVAPLVVDGQVVTAPQFSGARLLLGAAQAPCDLSWLVDGVALSADACASKLHGGAYPPGNPIALQAFFPAPPSAGVDVTVSAAGKAECDGLGAFTATGTVASDHASATFTWPAGAVASDTACRMTITVTFAGDASQSAPSSVSSTLPLSFLLRSPQPVFDDLPAVLPGNLPSQGFQATQTLELGDLIQLAPGDRRHAARATVVMSSWAKHGDYPAMDVAGFVHPVTLTIYDATTLAPLGSVKQDFLMRWRPEADPTCDTSTQWRAANGTCYNGFAFPITFDLSGLELTLPDRFVYGIAYDTNTWGYHPLHASGPYESLNVGLVTTGPSVGTDVAPDAVFWNTMTAGWYSDGGAGGTGTFRQDFNWAPYAPAVTFLAD